MPPNNRLLIVDDNAATRYAMRRTVERHGYTVLEAGTGSEGLAMIAANDFAGLILDVNLPDMSGFDIVRQLREAPETLLLPVIHVSAASIETGDMITGLDNGADAYLIHPVDPDVLLATIRTLLRVRETEDALRESEARFREIFINIGAPIGVVDARLNVIEANDAFRRLAGDAGCDGALEACFVPGQEALLEEMRQTLATRQRWRGDLSMHSALGTRETEWRVTPYRDDAGLVFIDDVTEQRLRERTQLEQIDTATTQLAIEIAERERSESQLLQAQKMDALGKLTGGIAHDFNNLLTSIITGIDLINRSVEAGKTQGVQRFADAALGSARRASALTHRLLAFARQQPLDAQATDVNDRVRSLEDMLRRTIGEHISLALDLDASAAIANVDANQLENAVINLVINARDAMDGQGVIRVTTDQVRIERDAEVADGDYIMLTVSDNGGGIPPEILDKVFEPFFTTKPLGQGTGLGLSMIYGFARQSGGQARIVSTVGKGTDVSLLLPVGQGEVVPLMQRALPIGGGRGERILVVEDTDSLRMMTEEILIRAGYECIATGDIEHALRVLRGDEGLDLLLTDVGMPGMNGRDLAEVARAWRPTLPVLFMTGYTENAMQRSRFLGTGMDMITKPFEIDGLLASVHAMFD
ncbi:hybrid sensor histidine kinase/response regulator [Luteibacter rhizovicinus DSM 16549]|uniref:histidine kinase n=1 Tax=Luteibacter rhizovicinus DSM 16549 TaxID=1440763 RepID=A0A0G9H8B8_9GAMM|nr:response regulator [Luteibacter rhizovicinus]APG04314.1 hybrid sensor histidine kinase/response regulator [Luteibacter rhizovicinus DSM 16549]KLD66055.1 histidine kinase [Luteibacter rhizovicinus DSM 16549]KLD73650.1 histidine kinase [Xanthomonas hyacinthi DSM 19077]